MQFVIKKKIGLCFVFVSLFLQAQQPNYLDKIIILENKISRNQFLDTILKIDFEKAMVNTKKYLLLTQKAEQIALNKDSISLAKVYEKMALAYHFSSKPELSIKYSLKAGQIYYNLNDIENQANTYINLGWQLKNRDLKNAILNFKKGIKILEKHKPTSYILEKAYNNYGVLKQREQQLDSALHYHNKAFKLSSAKKDSIAMPFAITHIAEVYMKQNKFREAEKLFLEALKIRQLKNDTYGVSDSFLYLGDLFYKQKKYSKAINYYLKGEELATKNGYYPLKKYATEFLFKSYEADNNLLNALIYHKKFTKLKDSVLNTETNNKIAELQIQFDSVEKEKAIAEQQLIIKNRNLYAIIITSVLLILGIIFFAIYKRNQLKRRQLQKEIDLKDALATIKTQNRLQEQRLKISRDLHDNIGSQLTFIISSIDNLKYVSKDANEKLKEKLAAISSFTGDTIHQLRDTIWAMNKSEISIEDLHARVLSFVEKAKKAIPNTTFEVTYDIDKNKNLSSLVGMNVFRVIQEAINNSIKYAEASKIEVHFSKKGDEFQAKITDNGKGFDIKNVDLGNGLSNMEKRMSEVDGKVKIISNVDKGTEIQLQVNTKNTPNDV